MDNTEGRNFIYSLQGENGEAIITEINLSTGYVNATKLCQSAGRLLSSYMRSKRTQEFLKELSLNLHIGRFDIVISKRGGNYIGTWVHPDVAIDLAAWCSPKFQVAVAKLVRRYMSGELTTNESMYVASLANDMRMLITSFHLRPVVYIGKVDSKDFCGAKIGSTDDLKAREIRHNREMGSFVLIKVFETLNHKAVERKILDECEAKGVRKSAVINGKNQTELAEFNAAFTWEHLLTMAEEIVNTNTHPMIVEKDNMIKQLENSTEIELEREKTRQLELQLELAKVVKEDIVMTENEEIDENEIHPIKQFIDKYCELGNDSLTDRFVVTPKDLHEKYVEKHNEMFNYPPVCRIEFDKYIAEMGFEKRKINLTYNVRDTWLNIRLKNRPPILIHRLIQDFVDIHCDLGETFMTDTKILYDEFEKYAMDKGFDAIKQNGFSRQNFKTQLFKLFESLKIAEWAVNGKKHAYAGIKLKNAMSVEQVIELFVKEKCVKGKGLRVRNIDLSKAFYDFVKDKAIPHVTRISLYTIIQKQNPELIAKHVTQCHMGFVGLSLKFHT